MLPTADLESRSAPDDHDALRLWLRLLTCTTLIESEIRSRLRARFDTTLPRFDLMAQLHRAPQGLKMGELSRRMMVSNGNLTGIADQLEGEALIVRVSDPSDRRSSVLKLTTKGKRVFTRMAREHERWIVEIVGPMTETGRAQLHRMLGELKQHAAAAAGAS